MKSLLSLIALAGAACISFAQVDVNRTVAVVNGDEIKGGEYYHRMEYLTGVGKVQGSGVQEFPPGFMTIERLISERLILQLAKKKGVYPSDPEVDDELKNRIADNPKFMEGWINSGQTEDDLKYQIRLQLAEFKVATAGVTITDQEVENHYKQYPTEFIEPKKVKLAVIVVRDDTAQQAVDNELKAKKSFAEVAKAHSTDVTKGVGGELGNIVITALKGPVQDAINKIQIGQTTEWLNSSDARVKFLLENVTPEEKLPLDAKLKRQLRKRLMLDAGKVKNNVEKEMYALRMTAKIDIKDKAFAEAYSQFMDAYKKDAALKSGGN